jgi:hypothetical protein
MAFTSVGAGSRFAPHESSPQSAQAVLARSNGRGERLRRMAAIKVLVSHRQGDAEFRERPSA